MPDSCGYRKGKSIRSPCIWIPGEENPRNFPFLRETSEPVKKLLPLLLLTACTQPSETDRVRATLDSTLRADTEAMNRYNWKASAALFTDDGTYAAPGSGVFQHGRAVLDSVMEAVVAGHRKDSLQADIQWETESLVVKDSTAYQVLRQVYSVRPGSREPFRGTAHFVLVWKKRPHWRVHTLMTFPD